MKTALRALIATVILVLLTGVLYPAVMTAFAQVALKNDANGSLVQHDGSEVGSSRIGQAWSGPRWFYGRPSAVDDDASTSSGSNLGPTSKPLSEDIASRIQRILKLEGPYTGGLTAAEIPVDLVTASASGLDPDISVAAAEFQAPRIAAVRNIPLQQVQQLIAGATAGKTLGFLGEPHVNVLALNLALDAAAPSS
jgi:potassium-transporting ATPase KdpC subunit